jgi:hypothetical protein
MLEINGYWYAYILGCFAGGIATLGIGLIFFKPVRRLLKPEPQNQTGFSDHTKAMIAKTEKIGEEFQRTCHCANTTRKDRIEDMLLEIEMNGQLIRRMHDELKRM